MLGRAVIHRPAVARGRAALVAPSVARRVVVRKQVAIRAVSETAAKTGPIKVSANNVVDDDMTVRPRGGPCRESGSCYDLADRPPCRVPAQVIYLSGPAAPGLQTKLRQVFNDLSIDVKRHDVNGGVDSGTLEDVYFVRGRQGGKLTDAEIAQACSVLEGIVKTQAAAAHSGVRPKFQTQTIAPDPAKRETLYAIMGARRATRGSVGQGLAGWKTLSRSLF